MVDRGCGGKLKETFVCLCVCLFVCLCVCLFVCLFVCVFVCLCVHEQQEGEENREQQEHD